MKSSIRSVTARSTFAVAGLLTALALTACGSTYDAAAPKNAAATGAAPAANTVASPKATATASPAPAASGDAGAANDVGQTPTTLRAAVVPKMGSVVTDEKGWILYRFDKDTANPPKSTCNGDCAKVWPPVIADDQKLIGIDPALIGEVPRADGARQVTLKGWPLYYYIGDKKPGTWKGQNVGGVWWVITPEGKKNLTCVPKNPPPAPKPPSEEESASPTASASKASNTSDSGSTY
jgi:predicted lipoprotein with Yx(FWY)xxD motif